MIPEAHREIGPRSNKNAPRDQHPEGLHERGLPRFVVSRATSRSRTVRMEVSAGATRVIGVGNAIAAYRKAPVPVSPAFSHVHTPIQHDTTARRPDRPTSANRAPRAQGHDGRFGTRCAEAEGHERGWNYGTPPPSPCAPPSTCWRTATPFAPSVSSRGSHRPASPFRKVSLLTPIALATSICRHPRSQRYAWSRSAKVWCGYRGTCRVTSISGGAFRVCIKKWSI
jgi:hypothetical protein